MRDRINEVRKHGFADHVLIYMNGRKSEYTNCAEADDPAVYDAATSWLRDRGVFWSWVHVIEMSCLGLRDANGAVIAIYLRNRWYSGVRPDDVSALLAKVFGPDASDLGVRPRDWPPRGRPPVSASRRSHRLLSFPPRRGRG